MFNSFFSKRKKDLSGTPSKDPVCGMQPTEGINLTHDGVTYSFCSTHCRELFKQNPESYIKKQRNN
ncbi:MAG: Copper-translocating P-type ATPase [Parcubacteria group bacterium GW2011_GWA2_47_16]|nr:MAG: Copper-translocating P-type ATPase [Parcubacteria group bacterium GW2011_GWA2_47_16]